MSDDDQPGLLPSSADKGPEDFQDGAPAPGGDVGPAGDPEPVLPMPLPAAMARRKVGRPKGARNKRDAETVAYLHAVGIEPLLGFATIVGRDTKALAKEMGCKPLEALDRQIRCLKHLAEYMHSKKPVGVTIGAEGGARIAFMLSPETAAAYGIEAESAPAMRLVQGEDENATKSTGSEDDDAAS